MEVENLSSPVGLNNNEDDAARLPGFRFHPTDEELVGFYLRRKVEKKPISIELIKHADIYKYDPWDLPKSNTGGDNEWYFFCKRGRKYRNSIRPNRVTGSGFWKATGIDRPVLDGGTGESIGLKKSLVFYRGSAGKGTKTDWMMHEFRLPPSNKQQTDAASQEAEVWTLCRILKRKATHRKSFIPDWRETASNPKTCSKEYSFKENSPSSYISFTTPPVLMQNDHQKKPQFYSHIDNQQFLSRRFFSPSTPIISQPPRDIAASSSFASTVSRVDIDEFLRYADWEDLHSMVDRYLI